jgi:hypothetical protein
MSRLFGLLSLKEWFQGTLLTLDSFFSPLERRVCD